MGLLDRFKRRKAGGSRGAGQIDTGYLATWAAQRHGVEAYVEPPTIVTELTVVLVAHDGEWTRRRIGTAKQARKLGEDLQIPVYDVTKVGYPQRMRDHDARARIEREREQRSRDAQ